MGGKSVYLGVSHVSHPKTAEFQGSPFWGVHLYLCLHSLTQNDQIQHERRVLGQPRHCICTNASRGLLAIAEFLLTNIRPILLKIQKIFAAV